jgi:hypothetical protein
MLHARHTDGMHRGSVAAERDACRGLRWRLVSCVTSSRLRARGLSHALRNFEGGRLLSRPGEYLRSNGQERN